MAAPSSATDTGIISLRDLIDFISHVADCYPEITKDFPQQLMDMLMQHHLVLEQELREKIVTSLVLLRKKEILDSATYDITLLLLGDTKKSANAFIYLLLGVDFYRHCFLFSSLRLARRSAPCFSRRSCRICALLIRRR